MNSPLCRGRVRRVVVGLALVCRGAAPVAAQTPRGVGGLAADSIVVVRVGRMFDSEHGVLLSARDILVRGGLVAAVGEHLTAPTGARIIDLTRYVVLPGLIDAHT